MDESDIFYYLKRFPSNQCRILCNKQKQVAHKIQEIGKLTITIRKVEPEMGHDQYPNNAKYSDTKL